MYDRCMYILATASAGIQHSQTLTNGDLRRNHRGVLLQRRRGRRLRQPRREIPQITIKLIAIVGESVDDVGIGTVVEIESVAEGIVPEIGGVVVAVAVAGLADAAEEVPALLFELREFVCSGSEPGRGGLDESRFNVNVNVVDVVIDGREFAMRGGASEAAG
ncbi:hypothetical protein Syun_011196 [Stephania yunnanensis]|uniref:Uncharacterized protein n=1 Tax=Stephania yunnanensis TaxID=152371 RepID=A0AAP0JXB8_9MAGN